MASWWKEWYSGLNESDPIGLYVWMYGPQLAELFEKD